MCAFIVNDTLSAAISGKLLRQAKPAMKRNLRDTGVPPILFWFNSCSPKRNYPLLRNIMHWIRKRDNR
jgi:hypothetical protein